MKKYVLFSLIIFALFAAVISGCKNGNSSRNNIAHLGVRADTIDIQPFDDISETDVHEVFEKIKKFCPRIQLKEKITLPATAFYPPRQRYRADSLIRFLSDRTPKNHVSVGLTTKDISTTNGDVKDWGVMGLGFCPGNACVVSTFRLSKKQRQAQFFKVAVHELGHTQGLPHCAVKNCFMRDAEGGNPLEEETGFCESCKRVLQLRGWQL